MLVLEMYPVHPRRGRLPFRISPGVGAYSEDLAFLFATKAKRHPKILVGGFHVGVQVGIAHGQGIAQGGESLALIFGGKVFCQVEGDFLLSPAVVGEARHVADLAPPTTKEPAGSVTR